MAVLHKEKTEGGNLLKFALRAALIAGAVFGCMLWTDGGLGLNGHADASAKTVSMTVNQQEVTFNSTLPILEGGSTMYVPIRQLAEQMNYDISWRSLGNNRVEVTIANGVTSITFRSEDKIAEVNGESVTMSNSPWSYNNTTYVPMRFLIDTLDFEFHYDTNLTRILPSVNRYAASSSSTANSGKSVMISKILNTAKSYLGVPYVWGGTSPSGFDCSGYINYVFGKHGINLPRTAQQMYKSLGTLKGGASAGDIVFFSESGKGITHAGISLGNGKYIHSSSGSTRGVIISDFSSSWAKRTYVGAKSVL